jgi:competence protein ComGC
VNDTEVAEVNDKFTLVERVLIIACVGCLLLLIGVGCAVAYLIAPDCEC